MAMPPIEWQDRGTTGFIFGCVVVPLFFFGGIALLVALGRRGNDGYAYAPGLKGAPAILVWRILVFGFCLSALGVDFKHSTTPWNLAYFTVWNWLIVNFYFFLGIMVSCVRVFKPQLVPQPDDHGTGSRFTRLLFSTFHIVGEMEAPMATFVAIVVWAYLAPNTGWEFFLTYSSISQHLVNAVIMTTDFFLAGYLVNPAHVFVVIVLASAYTGWHMIANMTWGIMCYPFMATNLRLFPAVTIALVAMVVLIYYVYFGLSKLKTSHCCCAKEHLTFAPVKREAADSVPRSNDRGITMV